MNGARRPPLRTFFALWPPAPTRDALSRAARLMAQACGAKASRPETIHLTLVFIGPTPVERVDALRALMDDTAGSAFSLQLDHYGWWRHNGIAWAGARAAPEPLIALQARLARGAERLGFSLDVRPYVPHVTLARDAGRSPPSALLAPLNWHVDSFVLISSEPGPQGAAYRVLHQRPLAVDPVAKPTPARAVRRGAVD